VPELAENVQAPVVVFVDADVCVHPDALRRIRDALSGERDISAIFGTYDLSPADPSLVSQYRNLLHSYVHRRDAGEAVTFWTGLGAVRREVLQHSGGFDEGERLDDIELGYRISALGHRIVLDPCIQGTHLKRWTLGSVITTDVADRAVPWLRLFLRGHRPARRATLNVRGLEQFLTALAAVAVVALGVGMARWHPHWLMGSGLALAGIVVTDWRFLRWLASQRGGLFALRAIPLRLLYFALNVLAVILALVPVSWRRRESRLAGAPRGGWLGQPITRGAKPGALVVRGVDSAKSLAAGSERAQPV
jgi:hypothetical protein